jgi:hypothetical protein
MIDRHSASLNWYQATICDPLSFLFSLPWEWSSDICGFLLWGALSDERMGL